ncbi:uncharacterized protein CIMG_03938 [Coccidioides immitis RS]|uniref:Uncharacterized protein n=1 Tax=Coccidioides immitis (strain RS) TaxID=246410 RepID=A0A0E1RWY2_COCIM|nr:uncharacterized protein CIMG_03938 [Coccidioides immitis RS]EAS32914.1 hypothetical protein CIMG_03938 [Coccidioides immitis RS]
MAGQMFTQPRNHSPFMSSKPQKCRTYAPSALTRWQWASASFAVVSSSAPRLTSNLSHPQDPFGPQTAGHSPVLWDCERNPQVFLKGGARDKILVGTDFLNAPSIAKTMKVKELASAD